MKLYDYLDNEYIGLNIELQKGYDPYKKAHLETIHDILGMQKKTLKFFWFFKVIFTYWLCALTGKWPKKIDLQEYLKEQQQKKLKAVTPVDTSKDTECQKENQVVS